MALPKNREITKKRRMQIISDALDGKPLKESAIKAGYAPKNAESQASQILMMPNVKEAFAQILSRSGVTEDFLSRKIRGLLEAKTSHFFASDGVVTDTRESEAHETQRKTAEMALKLLGHLKNDSATPQIINNSGLMQVVISQISKQNG